jgi:hypothetical protein
MPRFVNIRSARPCDDIIRQQEDISHLNILPAWFDHEIVHYTSVFIDVITGLRIFLFCCPAKQARAGSSNSHLSMSLISMLHGYSQMHRWLKGDHRHPIASTPRQ